METKELIVVGRGKLAKAILNNFNTYSKIKIQKYSPELQPDKNSVFVHVGSGRQYNESLQMAISRKSSYIQAATQKEIPMPHPQPGTVCFVEAANLDLNIIRLFYILKSNGNLFKNEKITITESHQREKQSQAGTALKFAQYLEKKPETIKSIRDPEVQKKTGISNLGQHAYHKISIGNELSKITIETKIEGAESYVKGLAAIVKSLPQLEKRNYEIDNLITIGLI